MRLFVLLLAASLPVAAARCEACHMKESHGSNAMRRAMEPVPECRILLANPKLTFNDPPYSYSLDRAGTGTTYTVKSGDGELTVKLLWALGQGAAGQTYIYERNGRLYESRVSYFRALNGLQLTMGARNVRPVNLEEAAGRLLSSTDAAECIGCHATDATARGVLQTGSMIPGIQCARCHEDSARHAAKVGHSLLPAKLGALSTEEMSNFCGQCHRTWEQIAANGPRNVNNVRFQPYRLANSKCYDAADPRIRCTACHDPHSALQTAPAAYDAKCQACHSAGRPNAKMCRTGARDCITCHMPKYELPGAHHAFTDHWIRTVKLNAPYPN